MTRYPRNGEPNGLPDTCIRWAEWNEQPAVQGFVAAVDKHQYVRDDLPIRCILRFYHAEEVGIDTLMDRTSVTLSGGVPFIKAERPELARRDVTIEFCDGALFYQFSFFPGSFSNNRLEQIVEEWMDTARSLQSRPDCPPDGGLQVAYRESIWEQVARYDDLR